MNTGILNILLLTGEIILGFILLFGKSYLQKKGENTADKEDSQEIAMLTELGKNIATKQDIQEIICHLCYDHNNNYAIIKVT